MGTTAAALGTSTAALGTPGGNGGNGVGMLPVTLGIHIQAKTQAPAAEKQQATEKWQHLSSFHSKPRPCGCESGMALGLGPGVVTALLAAARGGLALTGGSGGGMDPRATELARSGGPPFILVHCAQCAT